MKELKHTFKICPSCSFFCSTNEPDHYCSLCGSELIKECPSCQKEIVNPYAKFCKYCGKNYPGKVTKEKTYKF
ncbi:MAG: zinc ribbon domain-containing protein [Ignavibacteriaceae bacterium]|nr:zinc ribbon domain-containing protein [Ignavibacteriaceae bacterium]HRI45524.1 zinc ribbon domain-containing protein [Ignavibacteriaceae bacterium]